ncbi:MAG: hypothetical protein A2150_01805 [Candidatus Muproteobacteria bacterium RBG_16_64_11]|uniref:Small-conductance mechanosensitive channel n=1 Tax=Candidatus Muproteobacteria bacterium RBG_16_64_11 TaxID=1817758 RepID=A0A1F6TA03_9PROT|nr:MAG: hypothetical protein A2150_01805 [Candidatus Muproteobacteria bacterium RBG_16_64_11]
MGQVDVVFQTAQGFLAQIVLFLPKLLGGAAILIIGWLIAKALAFAVVRGLKMARFDAVTSKAGVDGFLKEGGIKKSTIDILGVLVYWFVILITLLTTFNVLGLGVVAELFNRIALFVPNVIVSVLILAIGMYFARLMSEAVMTYGRNVGMTDAELMGRLTRYAIMAFVIIIALGQINVGEALLSTAFLILFAAVCLGLALAFGLGGQKWAAGALERFMQDRGRKK